MKAWIAARYPGTKLALTEYNWGGDTGVSSALAQAEALAIFGREGVDLATRWVSNTYVPARLVPLHTTCGTSGTPASSGCSSGTCGTHPPCRRRARQGHIGEPDRHAAVRTATARTPGPAVENHAAAPLPSQVVHLDLTDDNLMRSLVGRRRRPDGMIDFGDLTPCWR